MSAVEWNPVIEEVRPVLAEYFDDRDIRIEYLGSAGGFSGARFWRLTAPDGLLCLRRWPSESPDVSRLRYIHLVLEHVGRRFARIPVPIRSGSGDSFVQQAGHLWELTRWLVGAADYLPERRPAKLKAAMEALAEWHVAAADGPRLPSERLNPCDHSPGVFARLNKLTGLLNGGWGEIRQAVERFHPENIELHELQQLAGRILGLFPQVAPRVERILLCARGIVAPLQPCIRDVWHDHILFDGGEVSGIVDFGALRIESVAGDVARLLGSLAGDDSDSWQLGLSAYRAIRSLSADELALVEAFDDSLALLSGMNWLEWVFLEGRTFEGLPALVGRVRAIVERLAVFSLVRRIGSKTRLLS